MHLCVVSLVAHLSDSAHCRIRSTMHDDIESTVGLLRRVDHRADILALRNISQRERGIPRTLANACNDSFTMGSRTSRDDDPRAVGSEGFGDRTSDAPAAARDESYLVIEARHGQFPLIATESARLELRRSCPVDR
jgi:hypothetical protein